jgi:hypothetical protein
MMRKERVLDPDIRVLALDRRNSDASDQIDDEAAFLLKRWILVRFPKGFEGSARLTEFYDVDLRFRIELSQFHMALFGLRYSGVDALQLLVQLVAGNRALGE